MKWNVKFDRQVDASLKDFRGGCVGRMRRYRWHNQGMIRPALDELASCSQGVLERISVRGREFKNSLRAHSSHTDFSRCCRHSIFEIVHIGKARHTAPDHLGAG